MINQQIRAFFLFLLASVVIFSKAYSDESKHLNVIKEFNGIGKTSLISKSSNSILDKKNVEEIYSFFLNEMTKFKYKEKLMIFTFFPCFYFSAILILLNNVIRAKFRLLHSFRLL